MNKKIDKEKEFLLDKGLQELFLTNDLDYKYIIFCLGSKEYIGYFLENRINEAFKISIEKKYKLYSYTLKQIAKKKEKYKYFRELEIDKLIDNGFDFSEIYEVKKEIDNFFLGNVVIEKELKMNHNKRIDLYKVIECNNFNWINLGIGQLYLS